MTKENTFIFALYPLCTRNSPIALAETTTTAALYQKSIGLEIDIIGISSESLKHFLKHYLILFHNKFFTKCL